MAREDVNIKVSANVAEAIQLWKAMEQGPEGMAKALDSMGQKGKTATKDWLGDLASMATKWLSVGTAIELARKHIEAYFQTLRQIEESQAKSTETADKALRPYYTRQRIANPQEQQRALDRITQQAMKRTSSVGAAGSAATMLSEFGFGREQAEGESLLELLTFQDSVTGSGGDSATMSRKVLEIIKRSGRPKTAESIRKLGITANRLTGRAAGFDAGMLEEYSNVASAAKDTGMSDEEGLSLWAAMREKQDVRQARPAFRGYMKPGLQRGEKELRARAQELLGPGTGAEQDYQTAADIGSSGIQSRKDESELGQIRAEIGKTNMSLQEARQRAIALLGVQGMSESQTAQMMKRFDDPWGPDFLYSTEGRVKDLAAQLFPIGEFATAPGDAEQQYQRRTQFREQAMGRQPLPVRPIRIVGPDGLDLPTEPAAAGLNQ